jgi:serine/threonine protein kinase
MQVNDMYCGTLTFMAPEVAQRQNYTKSVDLWAVGIIMHIVLTDGKHPFLTDSDNLETFRNKLLNLEKVKPHKSISNLASNLFLRLTAIHPASRYTAKDALKHPWITRMFESEIP